MAAALLSEASDRKLLLAPGMKCMVHGYRDEQFNGSCGCLVSEVADGLWEVPCAVTCRAGRAKCDLRQEPPTRATPPALPASER